MSKATLQERLKQAQAILAECCGMASGTPSEGNYDEQDEDKMEGGSKTSPFGSPMESDVGKDEKIRMKARALAKKLAM